MIDDFRFPNAHFSHSVLRGTCPSSPGRLLFLSSASLIEKPYKGSNMVLPIILNYLPDSISFLKRGWSRKGAQAGSSRSKGIDIHPGLDSRNSSWSMAASNSLTITYMRAKPFLEVGDRLLEFPLPPLNKTDKTQQLAVIGLAFPGDCELL